jgi:hypothetical protein
MALANQPSLQIIFENKTLLTTEGQLSLADRPVTEKSTQRSHTFEMYQTQENLNPPSWLSATDIFSDKRNVLGSIYESYTDFEYKKDEATIKGWSLYHKLLQSGKQQEFLEVYQNKYASFNFVGIELVSVDKMAIPKMGAEKYLQASVLLNQIANDKLRSSDSDAESRTEEIVFPEDLENSQLFFPSKESTKAFKQVVNLQISSITSGGKSTAFINEIKEGSENASKKIESIQSNLSGINQRFGTDFFASLSTSLEPVKEGFNEISEFLAQYDTGPTLGVYLRYTTQPYYIFSSQNPVILQNPWSTKPCAQVFRAISLKKISFSQEASIPVLPFLSVTLKGQVEFLHETSQYELLGLETFSYLKSIAPSVISDYIDLHIQEVLIILQQVTNYRSGCFQELAYEMESPDIHQEVKKSIVHLGIACFHTFSPRQQCPFSIPWQYSSNFSLLPNNNTLPDIEKKLNNLSNHIKGDYRAIGIESQMNFSRNLGSLWNQWNNNQDRRGMLIAKYKVNFFKSVTNQNILSNESDGSKKDLSDKIIADKNYTDFVSDFNALLMQQPSLDKKISSIMRSSASDFQKQILMNEVFKYVAEGPRSLGCFVSLLDLEKTIASLLDYRHQSVVSNTPRTLRGLWDITDDSDTITGWGAVWLHFSKRIGGLNPDPYLYNFEGQKPLVPNVVPKDTEWQADRGLNMFHGAWWGESAATEALKKSLLSFHNELAKNEMIFSHQMKIKGVGRDIDKYIEVKRYILQRIMLADNLDGSIQAWKKNKSDETSKRMANVVMQVEIPLLYDLDRLILVYCLNEILWLLREQSESSSPDVASLGSDQIRLLKATLIQYLQHFADESATHAVVHGVKQWIVPL